MDLVYMPEVLSYGALRHPQYRDYEQPWNKDYFNHGKSTTRLAKIQQRQQQNYLKQKQETVKKSCTICKENKRRTLAAYIRGKGRNNSCSEIHEEIEENEEEEEEEEVEEEEEEVKKDEQKKEQEKKEQETDILIPSDGMNKNSNQSTIQPIDEN